MPSTTYTGYDAQRRVQAIQALFADPRHYMSRSGATEQQLNLWHPTQKPWLFFDRGQKKLNVNLIGLRDPNQKVGVYDDLFWVLLRREDGSPLEVWEIVGSLDPDPFYLDKRIVNAKGCAIIVEGQHRGAYKLGTHFSYRALVQAGSFPVYRDHNRDSVLDLHPDSVDTRRRNAINFHKGGKRSTRRIAQGSAGCQTVAPDFDRPRHPGRWQTWHDFIALMEMCRVAWTNSFTFTVIRKEWLDADMQQLVAYKAAA